MDALDPLVLKRPPTAIEVATQAIHLMEGSNGYVRVAGLVDTLHDGFGSDWYARLVAGRAVIVANVIAEVMLAHWDSLNGVYEYDVTEPMGVWLAQNLQPYFDAEYGNPPPVYRGDCNNTIGDAAFEAELRVRTEHYLKGP